MKDLITRLENADGPSRELDAAIRLGVFADGKGSLEESPFNGEWCCYNTDGKLIEFSLAVKTAAFTSSIDAALTLEASEEDAVTMLWAAISDAWSDIDTNKETLTKHRVLKALLIRALKARGAENE